MTIRENPAQGQNSGNLVWVLIPQPYDQQPRALTTELCQLDHGLSF